MWLPLNTHTQEKKQQILFSTPQLIIFLGMAPERDDEGFRKQIPEALEFLDKGMEKVHAVVHAIHL